MGQRKNPTPKPDLQLTGHLVVSGQAPHLVARPGEAGIPMDFIITFASLALEGVHRNMSLYEVLTRSQGEPINNGLIKLIKRWVNDLVSYSNYRTTDTSPHAVCSIIKLYSSVELV